MIQLVGERVFIFDTEEVHLKSIHKLWNEPNVMKWVGFPDGVNIPFDKMKDWLIQIQSSSKKKHFVIFDLRMNFCGELYFENENDFRAGLDIKLLPAFQGKGYATEALQFLIAYVFENYNDCSTVWTEPAKSNSSAIELYARCGFTNTYIDADENKQRTYWELKRNERTINSEVKQVHLRPIQPKDIDDYIRWYTTETEWMNWDAPWEMEDPIDMDDLIVRLKKRMNNNSGVMEIYLSSGEHIGWVSSYYIDDDTTKLAVGIDIPEVKYRSQGNGSKALEYWINYNFCEEKQMEEVYTQTWSGNEPMIGLAKKLGFQEVTRKIGIRQVRGNSYDALTFKLKRNSFFGEETRS